MLEIDTIEKTKTGNWRRVEGEFLSDGAHVNLSAFRLKA